MKRLILTLVAMVAMVTIGYAQNYIVVNSEKIFKSIEAYNTAIIELDRLAESYQLQVDAKFREVENMYNAYVARKGAMSVSSQATIEGQILAKEQEATKFQESIFGTDGTLMKKRIELIQPIQQRVFKAIEEYSQAKGYELVLDVAQNAEVLYYSPKADHTQAIIDQLK
ncbi:MAG: OmpH family outer membrane protein [Alistipes sp.]|nr:OmpH family outer membrane protein [Alistipes sp.]